MAAFDWINSAGLLLRRFSGVGLTAWLTVVIALAVVGAGVGLLFPKFEATALLQFPEVQKAENKKLANSNIVELAAFKRVAASYDSAAQLETYLREAVPSEPAAERLLRQAQNPGFWTRIAVPILPFSRRDQKEFGDIKDASATTILGLELIADARSPAVAADMVRLLAGFYVNAVMRERVRTWTLTGKRETQAQEKATQADILEAELDIELFGRRAQDMKAILARYPDSAKMDGRQLVAINAAEGGERYLSPLAQLVGAESAISQRHELVRRWQRDLAQKQVLARFYTAADSLVDREFDARKILEALRKLAIQTFDHKDSTAEWNREAALRVNAALDNFEVMKGEFGVRNGIRVDRATSRDPLRLAGLGAMLGVVLLGALAFLRTVVQSMLRADRNPEAGGHD